MKTWQLVSSIIVVIMPAIVIIYDIAVKVFFGTEATLSFAIEQMAEKWSELPFVAGGLFLWLWLHLFFCVVMRQIMAH